MRSDTSASTRAPLARRAPKLPVEERRAQLLKCALSVFARKGIAAAGHADVAAEAGVAVPTVFGYFPTRSDLVRAVVEEVDRFILGNARRASEAGTTVSERLIGVLRDFTDTFETNPEYARIWVSWATSFDEDVWPLYLDFTERTIQLHRDVLGAARDRGEISGEVDPEMSAYLFIGASTTIIQMKIARRDPQSIARYLETTIHGALHQS